MIVVESPLPSITNVKTDASNGSGRLAESNHADRVAVSSDPDGRPVCGHANAGGHGELRVRG